MSGVVGEAAFILSLGGAFAFMVLYALRSGSGDSATAVFGLMAQSVLPVLVGAAVLSSAFASSERRNIMVAAATIAAFLVPTFAIFSRAAASFLTLGFGLYAVVSLLRHKDWLRRVSFGSLVFRAGVVACLLLVSNDPVRIFIPEQMTLGIAGPDHLLHAAIAQMISRYGRVATGADGLAYQQYYFLSHAVAAGLSVLTHASVPLVYAYWGAVSLKLQLLWGIFIASLLLDDEAGVAETGMMARVIFAWFVAVFTRALESESFVLGMAIFLMLLPLLCDLVRARDKPPWLIVVVAIIGAFICAATKASIGFFVAVALFGAAWRLKRFCPVGLGIAASLCLLAIVTLHYLSPANDLLLDAGWHVLLTSYSQYLDSVAVISFALPILLLLVAARQPRIFSSRSETAIEWRVEVDTGPRIRPYGSFRRWVGWLLDVSSGPMFLLGLSLIACVAVLFSVPIGSNVAYFSLVLLVMAAVIAPATLRPRFKLGIEKQSLQRALSASVAMFFCVMAVQFAWDTKNAVAALYRSAFSAAPNHSTGGLVVSSIRTHHSLLAAVREQSEHTPWSRLTKDILSKSADGFGLSVHTAPAVDEFWTRLSPGNPWWCITSHLMVPAELGIVQIRNIAPLSIETQCVSEGISFYGYGKTQDMHRTAELSDEQLCAAARQSKFERVYVVNSLSDLKRNPVLNCV
jgi:hypothetical protein